MFKKIIASMAIVTATSLFGMSINDLNKASKEELMAIKGIGASKAEAIIAERKKEKFKSVEDVTRVKGIGEVTAANIKNDVKSGAKKSEDKKSAKKDK